MTSQRTESSPSSPASAFATALLGEFVASGVTDLVLSPGSRSQALALAAAQFERAGLLRLRVRIDERSAGFLALGLAVQTCRPVLIVTTSGTAVAELHPAVLEAAHSGVPLIVLSADRPAELRDIGSNQTTVQPGMFGSAAEKSWDVPAPVGGGVDDTVGEEQAARELVAEVLSGIRAVRHVNLAFREPLSSPQLLPDIEPGAWRPAPAPVEVLELAPRPGTVVVAGTGAGEAAEAAARALGAPLLAEVASGARFGPNLVAAYREVMAAGNFGDRVERVVVFGHPTLSREIPTLIQRDGVETIVVRGPGRDDYNPGHRVSRFVDAVTIADDPAAVQASRGWVMRWVMASRAFLDESDDGPGADLSDNLRKRADFARAQLAALRARVTRGALVRAVWNASWPHDRLVLASSRLIRELDRVAPGKKIPVHANRGLAGIDGTIATAVGIALAQQSGDEGAESARGITRVLLGDLAMLHDAGSLAFGVGETRPSMQLIVGNDGGGTIFDGLEVAGTAEAALVDRVLLTPQRVDLSALAAAYGWDYRKVETRGELDPALTPSPGQVLIEVPLSR